MVIPVVADETPTFTVRGEKAALVWSEMELTVSVRLRPIGLEELLLRIQAEGSGRLLLAGDIRRRAGRDEDGAGRQRHRLFGRCRVPGEGLAFALEDHRRHC